MTTFSNMTGHRHPGKPAPPSGPLTAGRNNTNRAAHPFLATKTTNALKTGDSITVDVARPNTVDLGHETPTHVPPPPPQPPPLPGRP